MVQPLPPRHPGDPWLCPICGADLVVEDGEDGTTFHCTPACGFVCYQTPLDDSPDDRAE